jgi:peroxiredoxin
MRTLLLLMIAASAAIHAQTPQQLLQLAQDAYKDPSGYEITGHGAVQPVGSSWRMSFPVLMAAAPAPLDDPHAPVSPAIRTGNPFEYTKVGDGSDSKPMSLSIPFAVVGGFSRIAENVESVKETGAEQLSLNNAPVDCRVLEVQYKPREDDDPKPPPVRYSICGDKHLVLKKVMSYSTDRHPDGPAAPWTVTFDIAKFHRPAPAWLIDPKSLPQRIERDEWLGHAAPAFQLRDLDGHPVELSSLRGKLVLLNFWSITCAPCVKELPDLQKFAAAHKDVTVWGVSLDQPDRDKKWLAQHQQSFPTLSDKDYDVSDLYKVHGIPATILIGPDGTIHDYWEGSVTLADLEGALHQLLNPDSDRAADHAAKP